MNRHIIIEDRRRHNWPAGILAVVCLILLFGWADERDRADQAALAAELYARHAARMHAQHDALQAAPAIRLTPHQKGGFNCTAWKIRDPWIGAAAERCAQLGQFLTMARRIDE